MDTMQDGSTSSPKTHSPSRPVKPILKHHSPHPEDHKKKGLSWDEDAIEEHDQLRGTRMKIDEPNTPYTHYEPSTDDPEAGARSPAHNTGGICMDTLEQRLEKVAEDRQQCPGSPNPNFHTMTEKQHHEEFAKHRHEHYNEIAMLKKFRQEHPTDDWDDEDDDEPENMKE